MSATTTLSDEDKREIGQHFVFGFHGYNVTTEIETLIRDYHLGHVILMKRNVQSAEQVYDLIEKLQAIAKDAGHNRPLMIGTDQENGLVSAFSVARSDAAGTQFPGAMALAASGSVKLAEEVYNASAKELKLVGINWAYSPVADVNSDPRNPIIGVRSFGDDPDVVGRFVAAASRGLTSGGVAPSLKHFPGHGDTHVDSHLALPVIPKDLDALKRTELVPFAACLDAATIMTGHMALPTLTGNDSPASLSRAATYGLAREQLKYDGAIVTDCLEMDAVAAREGGVPRGAVEALKAGADVVMACHTYSRHVGTVEAVYAAVASGEISRDELVDSGKRVTALKDKFAGSWTDVLPGSKSFPHDEWLRLKAAHRDLSMRAYAATTALVQDPANLLSVQPVAHKVVLITPIPESLNLAVDDAEGVMRTRDGKSVRNTAGPSYLALADAVRAHRPDGVIHLICGPEQEADIDENAVRDADVVLFVTRNAHSARWQLERLRRVASVRGGVQNGVIVVQSCAPYDLLGMEANDDLAKATVLATFEFTLEGLAAAVAVVFGEHKAAGVVPVCGGKIVG